MSEHTKSFEGNEQPDFLSIINSEVEKVEPTSKVPPTPLPCKHHLLYFLSLCQLPSKSQKRNNT